MNTAGAAALPRSRIELGNRKRERRKGEGNAAREPAHPCPSPTDPAALSLELAPGIPPPRRIEVMGSSLPPSPSFPPWRSRSSRGLRARVPAAVGVRWFRPVCWWRGKGRGARSRAADGAAAVRGHFAPAGSVPNGIRLGLRGADFGWSSGMDWRVRNWGSADGSGVRVVSVGVRWG